MGITTLFLDIGGVLLTNGWDHKSRELASKTFHLDLKEMNSRHNLTFDTYELGKISLDTYLNRVVFYEKRSFTPDQFKEFMFSQSQPYQEMLDLIRKLKQTHHLKIAVVSNEGRELNEYRIKKFQLDNFIDFFISSSYVHLKKPDEEIFQLALNVAHVKPNEVLYIEDRPMFVQVAKGLGIHGHIHQNYKDTEQKLSSIFNS